MCNFIIQLAEEFEILSWKGSGLYLAGNTSKRLGRKSQESARTSDTIDFNMAPAAEKKKEKEATADKKDDKKSKDETKKEEEPELVTLFLFCLIVLGVLLRKMNETNQRDSSTFLTRDSDFFSFYIYIYIYIINE